MAKVKVDMAGVAAKVARIANDKGLGMFAASELMGGMDPYVPFREGYLARSATPSPFKVTYTQPYAHRVYEGRGMTIRKEKHPLATSKWDEAWAKAHIDGYAAALERYIDGM